MHDPKCLELATHFLPSDASKRIKSALAERIQEAIEMWFCNVEQFEAGLRRMDASPYQDTRLARPKINDHTAICTAFEANEVEFAHEGQLGLNLAKVAD